MNDGSDTKPGDAGAKSDAKEDKTLSKDAGVVELMLINPNSRKLGDLRFRVRPSTTVRELKEMIRERYEGHPPPQDQVLIHAGKLLKDSGASIGDILQTVDGPGPYSFHLVVPDQGVRLQQRRSAAQRAERAGTGRRIGSGRGLVSGGFPGEGNGTNSLSNQPPAGAGRATESPSLAGPGVHQVAMVPAAALALPCVMMSPVVSAAYNAALAAMWNSSTEGSVGDQQEETSSSGNPQGGRAASASTGRQSPQTMTRFAIPQLPLMPGAFPPGTQTSPQSGPHGENAESQGHQPTQGSSLSVPQASSSFQIFPGVPNAPPLVPAIAFFPLGLPVLVPSSTPLPGLQTQPPPHARIFQLQGNRFVVPGTNPAHHARAGPPNQHVPAPGRGARRRRVLMFRISVRGLLQLVLILTFLYNYCTKGRFFLLVGLFVLLYLMAGPLCWLLSRVSAHHRGNLARNREDRNLRFQQNGPLGFLMEVAMLVVGFVTSLLPTWNVNAQDEVAFAAGQGLEMRDGDRDGVNNVGNDNGAGNENGQQRAQQQGRANADANHLHQE